jgi:hypothetical protein
MKRLVATLALALLGCSTADICSNQSLPPAGEAEPISYHLPTDHQTLDGTVVAHSWPEGTQEWHQNFDSSTCSYTSASIVSPEMACYGTIALNGYPSNGIDGHVRPVFKGECDDIWGQHISPVYSIYRQ